MTLDEFIAKPRLSIIHAWDDETLGDMASMLKEALRQAVNARDHARVDAVVVARWRVEAELNDRIATKALELADR